MQSPAESTASDTTTKRPRWLAVLPAFVLAGFAVLTIVGVVTSPASTGRVLSVLLTQLPLGAAIVVAGAVMAPRYRLATAIALALLWTLLSFMTHVLKHPNPHFLDYLAALAAGAGSVGGVAFVDDRNRRNHDNLTVEDPQVTEAKS